MQKTVENKKQILNDYEKEKENESIKKKIRDIKLRNRKLDARDKGFLCNSTKKLEEENIWNRFFVKTGYNKLLIFGFHS